MLEQGNENILMDLGTPFGGAPGRHDVGEEEWLIVGVDNVAEGEMKCQEADLARRRGSSGEV